MRQKYIVYPFGVSGDQTTIPDPTQVSGTVSFQQGWPFNYQRQIGVDPLALPIDRATMNYLFEVITAQIQQYQQFGFPEWITSANNGGTPYAYDFGAVVRYSATGNPPFTTYVSTLAGTATNTDTPGATANWQLITLSTAQIQAMIEAMAGNYYLDTGAANAYVIAMNPPVTAYTNGMPFSFRVSHANTGASTLDAGAGAVALVNNIGGALVSGDLPINSVVSGFYDSAAGKFLISTLVSSQVLSQAAGDIRYAKLAGLSSQAFATAALTASGLITASLGISMPNGVYLSSRNSSGANTRMIGIAGDNTVYIGPIDTIADAVNINYGISSNIAQHDFYIGGSVKAHLTSSGVAITGTLSATGKASAAVATTTGDLAAWQQVPGLGQVYVDRTASRAVATTYTNSTSQMRKVCVSVSAGVPINFTVGGVKAQEVTFGGSVTLGWIAVDVPPGQTYVLSGGSINYWAELG